jgi:hypothetical protein
MAARLAFTARLWGGAAVVCRAVEDRPGPIVEQEFGEFETWTQALAFATCLNEGLELDPREAQSIVASATLHTTDLLSAALSSRSVCDDGQDRRTGEAGGVPFMLAELDLALTFCHIVFAKPSLQADRVLRNARNVLFNAIHFVFRSELSDHDLEQITSRLQRVQAVLSESAPQTELWYLADGETWV